MKAKEFMIIMISIIIMFGFIIDLLTEPQVTTITISFHNSSIETEETNSSDINVDGEIIVAYLNITLPQVDYITATKLARK